jgi:hypothetical protein
MPVVLDRTATIDVYTDSMSHIALTVKKKKKKQNNIRKKSFFRKKKNTNRNL